MKFFKRNNDGVILINAIIFAGIATALISGLISWFIISLKASRQIINREQALQIAEAGVDYYRWHLAHAQADYKDGTNSAGPYVHDFYDMNGVKIGKFTLTITPPPIGSTKVTIQSKGEIDADASIKRTIKENLAIPSLAKYAVVANDNMRFGQGTEVFGPVHSNGGIRFDGLAHNIITSGKASYDDLDHAGALEFGVHTHVVLGGAVDNNFRALEAPPASVQSRSDVFVSGRTFPVPVVDFSSMTTDLATIKAQAQSGGRYFASSGFLGYHIVLKTNGTFDLYKVKNLLAAPNGCTDPGQTGWGTWSIATNGNPEQFVGNFANPANGLIFLEDHLWIDGKINGARLTIAAARFPDSPATRRSITINKDLLYTNYDGTDVIALIAQDNINAGMASLSTMRIDSAMIAQNGRVGRYYYGASCAPYNTRTTLTLYGMLATAIRYGFAYTDGTGYQTRSINYDANLLYSPPPNFPLTSDQYTVLSWEEVE